MLTFLDSLLPGPRLPSPPSPQLSWTTRVPSLPTMHENWIGPWATACSDLSRNPPSLQTGSSFGQGTLGGLAPGLHFQLNQADSLLPAPSPPPPQAAGRPWLVAASLQLSSVFRTFSSVRISNLSISLQGIPSGSLTQVCLQRPLFSHDHTHRSRDRT